MHIHFKSGLFKALYPITVRLYITRKILETCNNMNLKDCDNLSDEQSQDSSEEVNL